MAVVRCKMCGGTLELNHDETVGICEYCGTRQTLPKLGNEQKANLYERANHLRRNNEYDKAMGIYEQILNADRTDAESYWSLVLCRYGIEYVEDPASHKRIPTVNRAQFTSIFADEDYKSAIYYADALQKEIYEQEAKAIDEIQKGILAISQKEKPFDVFICYKETDSNGRRTPDSVLATDLYHQLKQEGFKVFFSRITLEDKLGVEYEPYIFAALNSAKVMVVLGTKPEYLNAVWVKNEWSRYLALIKNGAKKMLIPAYRDMDPYDLPEEFSHLQAQDMGKLGFMQDLIRGIKKIVSSEISAPAVKETVVVSGAANANAAPLLRRVFIFLEDGDFVNADEYCEKVLDMEPENAEAYLGKMMAELRVRKREDLALFDEPFDENGNYKKALRFADEAFAAELRGYISAINERKENRRLEALYKNCVRVMETSRTEEDYINAAKNFEELGSFRNSAEMANRCRVKAEEIKTAKLDAIYNNCIAKMNSAKTEADYKKAADFFKNISGYRDADEMAKICLENAEKVRLQGIYDSAKAKMAENKIKSFEQAIEIFRSISAFKDSENQVYFCQGKIEEIKAKEAEERIERERKAELKRIADQERRENAKHLAKIWSPIVAGVLAFAILLNFVVVPNFDYIKAEINTMVEEAKAEKAEKDAEKKRKEQEKLWENMNFDFSVFENDENIQKATALVFAGEYDKAIEKFSNMSYYDSRNEMTEYCETEKKFHEAYNLLGEEKYEEALDAFNEISDFSKTVTLFSDFLSYEENAKAYEEYLITKVEERNIINFGSYEQDNNLENGKEPIEWIVLDKDLNGEEVLVISKKIIEAKKYSDYYYGTPHYFTPSLQKWLNETFYNKAFSEEEKGFILQKEKGYSYDLNLKVKGSGSVNTKLRFLTETEYSFSYFEILKGPVGTTPYVLENYSFENYSSDNIKPWYLIGGVVRENKSVGLAKSRDDYIGVRPAMWLSLNVQEKTDAFFEKLAEYCENYLVFEPNSLSNPFGEISVGGIVTFGSYEQDNNLENGAEPIEWQVLDVQDGKALVISKYGLDCQPYNTEYKAVTWETCSLRKWLNKDFINRAFSAQEQKNIKTTKLSNFDNPEYGTDGENDTLDKIFVLCIEEIEEYFESDRLCKATDYVKGQKANTNDNGDCWWWLRTLGTREVSAAAVKFNEVVNYGYGINVDTIAVRPAMWIDLAAFEEPQAERETETYTLGLGTVVSQSVGDKAQVDATIASAVIDADGIIVDIDIDVAQSKCPKTNVGDYTAEGFDSRTKTEKGSDYGMIMGSRIGKEWYEQKDAFEAWAIGKTVDYIAAVELVESNGHMVAANEADLYAGCTMQITAFQEALVDALNNTVEFTTDKYFKLGLGVVTGCNVMEAFAGKDGSIQMYSDYAAVVTTEDDIILAARLDGVQPKIGLEADGTTTGIEDLRSKYTKKEDYGMIVDSHIGAEWYTQADAYCEYLVDKTAADLKAVELVEHNGHMVAANEADLYAGCTMQVSTFIEATLKAIVNADKNGVSEQAILLSETKVGDVVTFGSYEQDNNLENGAEPIEWQVLDIQDGKALVISKYGLDSKPYNDKYVDVTWETCSLRKWLNSGFINGAFSAEEQKMIAKTSLVNPDNPSYKTRGGNDTEDKVFLLSIDEANKYFSSDAERQCKPSAYAKEQGVWVADNGNCWWWLRSPGLNQDFAARVSSGGRVLGYGYSVYYDSSAVRPAMWVDLSAFEK